MLWVVVFGKQQGLMGKYGGLWVCFYELPQKDVSWLLNWEFQGIGLTRVCLGQYLIESLLQIGSNSGTGFSPSNLRINRSCNLLSSFSSVGSVCGPARFCYKSCHGICEQRLFCFFLSSLDALCFFFRLSCSIILPTLHWREIKRTGVFDLFLVRGETFSHSLWSKMFAVGFPHMALTLGRVHVSL